MQQKQSAMLNNIIILQATYFSKRSRVNTWKLVTEDLSLLMPVHFIPEPILRMPFSLIIWPLGPYLTVVSFDQFKPFFSFLHFTDKCEGPPDLFKLSPVLDHLNSKFMILYLLQQNISIDG
jgi:hypothetical protein